MTPTTRPARPPRSAAEYRWTHEKALAFLYALAEHGKVAAAARAVGMTRQSAYRLRRRYPALAAEWASARAHGRALRLGELQEPSPCPPQGDSFGAAR